MSYTHKTDRRLRKFRCPQCGLEARTFIKKGEPGSSLCGPCRRDRGIKGVGGSVGLNPESPQRAAARAGLPEKLRPIFDELVDEYAAVAAKNTGRAWACYSVLADLVRLGWVKP